MNLELNTAERLTPQELSLHHRYADFRRRALGMLALAKDHPLPIVADILGVTPQTVYNWLKAWRTRGLRVC
jgi:transposase